MTAGLDHDTEMEGKAVSRSGDPLAAMYVLAAVAMGIAFIVIFVLIFIPTDWFEEEPAEVWVPGSGPGWSPPAGIRALSEPPGVREVAPGRYVAVIQAFNWEFLPNEVRVPAGSEVTFRARSSQDYHGIAIIGTPIVVSLGQNQVREVSHTFEQPGEYFFVCSEYCGGGHVNMLGRIVVE